MIRTYFNTPRVVEGDEVLVTRCPCVQPWDGKRLRVCSQKPPGMSETDWQALNNRGFGELIFPRSGQKAVPELIAEGDLDGDLYWISWDAALVASANDNFDVPNPLTAGDGATPSAVGSSWLTLAQKHMLDPKVLEESHLIGRLYRAAEKRAEKSSQGLQDPDVQALFRAYVQSIDTGKHGNGIEIPQHLRKELGLK